MGKKIIKNWKGQPYSPQPLYYLYTNDMDSYRHRHLAEDKGTGHTPHMEIEMGTT